MKHVIVIETAPLIDAYPRREILAEIESILLALGIESFTQSRFNVESAIAATHEMYNAPEWKGGL